MRVQRVTMPGSRVESWTVLGDDLRPVEPVERFLAFLAATERSPNTVKAYAHDLKDWFTFLDRRGLDWRSVTLEDVAGFVGWLRLPPAARERLVLVLPSVAPHCSSASVNRKLAALASFCEFHARHGVPLGGLLARGAPVGAGRFGSSSFRPFLHHISKSSPQRRRAITLPTAQTRPRVLSVSEAQRILDGCEHLRDRLLFGLLLDTGVRIGEALGLRHEDVAIAEQQIAVVPRENANQARAKGGRGRVIPASGALMRLYADYLNVEYGALDSDYVFVNLWGSPHGGALTYAATYDLVRRLRRRTGVDFGPHWFRHTLCDVAAAPRRGDGVGAAVAGSRVDHHHRGHLRPSDCRGRAGEPGAGWLVYRKGGSAVTAVRATTPSWPRLREKLMAVVRPEFRVGVLVADPADAVLGRGVCPVADCDRALNESGLCSTHGQRWRARGQPELAVFLGDPGPPINGRRDLAGCIVNGCRFGSSGFGVCMRHRHAWQASDNPDAAAWAASVPVMDPEGRVVCRLPFCSLWVECDRNEFCKAHETRWRMQGRPDVEEFIEACLVRGKARIDFRELPPLLKLEFQYAAQCRVDQATIKLPPPVAAWAIRQALSAGVVSLLDRSPLEWAEIAGPKTSSYPTFLAFARDMVESLHEGTGWEVEYPREVWRLHRIPGLTASPGKAAHPHAHLRFDRLTQPWLRNLAKRWARLRLSTGLNPNTVSGDVTGLTRFSSFLSIAGVDTLAGIDRGLLERYLAWLASEPIGPGARSDAVTAPNGLFQAIRQHGWDPTLPTTAVFFSGDLIQRPPRLTRRISEFVMSQIEAPENLNRWPNPEGRLITVILTRCGLRTSDACTLAFDCLLHDGTGAPYLRYFNHKMRREAAVPIDEDLQVQIRTQQQRVKASWSERHPHLFPSLTGNAEGRHPITYYSYRGMLNAWLAVCGIHDETGEPVKLTPHQWRHTFACRLINQDVPQEVIRVLLDHESTQMTAHYARITDQTVRRRWEQAAKVNIRGEQVLIEPDGPLAQAQWARTRYNMATVTLPNGYCGLPVQNRCPHANACLTCAVFLTGPEFLPELREHRCRTLTLIDNADASGHTRVAQMNKDVLANLDTMIGQLHQDPQGAADAS